MPHETRCHQPICKGVESEIIIHRKWRWHDKWFGKQVNVGEGKQQEGMSRLDALHCANILNYIGNTDWRLSNAQKPQSIVDYALRGVLPV